MEWVEVTAPTSLEARRVACEKLGVAEDDVEFVVLSEPRNGLFGRVRGEARIRARVKPLELKSRQSFARGGSRRRNDKARRSSGPVPTPSAGKAAVPSADEGPNHAESGMLAGVPDGKDHETPLGRGRARRPRSDVEAAQGRTSKQKGASVVNGEIVESEIVAIAEEFLLGVAERFGLQATLAAERKDSETISVSLLGDGLGLLIGARGATLAALQDLLRLAIIQRTGHVPNERVIVDVAGYRARRAEALAKFARDVGKAALEQQCEQVLEPMSPADRKVVHDAITSMPGLSTRSDGLDPSRWVVVFPSEG